MRDAQRLPHMEPEVEPDLEPSRDLATNDDVEFEDFWTRYPRRNGKRVGKPAARIAWGRLSAVNRARAKRNVEHYRASCDAGLAMAKDAERWLRRGMSGGFEDWDEPATNQASGPSRRQQAAQSARDQFVGGEQPTGAVAAAFYGQTERKALGQ